MNQLPDIEEIFFDDRPEFTPHYSPLTMLKCGVFGGTYFNEEPSALQGWQNVQQFLGSRHEFWKQLNETFPKLSDFAKLSNGFYDKENNFFKVRSGKDQAYWEDKGWIHPDDPRGWFEWYIKFYYGRRHEDDDRQIKRWSDFITRHSGMLVYLTRKHLNVMSLDHLDREEVIVAQQQASPVTCQNLLQWSWNFTYQKNK